MRVGHGASVRVCWVGHGASVRVCEVGHGPFVRVCEVGHGLFVFPRPTRFCTRGCRLQEWVGLVLEGEWQWAEQ